MSDGLSNRELLSSKFQVLNPVFQILRHALGLVPLLQLTKLVVNKPRRKAKCSREDDRLNKSHTKVIPTRLNQPRQLTKDPLQTNDETPT